MEVSFYVEARGANRSVEPRLKSVLTGNDICVVGECKQKRENEKGFL